MIGGEKPGKEVFTAEDRVEENCADEAEDDETNCILRGIHFNSGIDARKTVDPSLDGDA